MKAFATFCGYGPSLQPDSPKGPKQEGVDRSIMNGMASLEQCPALILNADFRPLSYFPLSTCSWQDAVKAVFRESVFIVSEYEQEVHSPSHSIRLPSVLALKEYVVPEHKPAFTRFNVFLRDAFRCQYCGQKNKAKDLTFDHVIPRARGGRTSWENIVTACRSCNRAKGAHMPENEFRPMRMPKQPDLFELQEQGKRFPSNFLHESWGDFLYWSTELVDQ